MLAAEFLPRIPDDQLDGAPALAAVLEVHGLMDPDEARQLRVAIYRRFTARPELVQSRRVRRGSGRALPHALDPRHSVPPGVLEKRRAMTTFHSVRRVCIRQVRESLIRFAVSRVERPQEVYEAVKGYYRGADREILSVLCLDAQNQPVCFSVVAAGDLNITRSRPVDVMKPAILSNSVGFVLIHNHPSGSPEPSLEDIEFTRGIRRASETLGIELCDHLILGDDGYPRRPGALRNRPPQATSPSIPESCGRPYR